MEYDIVIMNGMIVAVNPGFDIIQNGIICIKDSRLHRVESWTKSRTVPETKQLIDANGAMVLPGLVNTHTHLPMTLFRGLADDLPLHEWLENHIFPAEAKHIYPESVKIATRLACAEMIMSGTTTCCDGYFLENEVAQAVLESGLRAVLAQGVIDFPAPGCPDPGNNISHASEYISKWMTGSPLIKPSVFCHSPYTCSPETLTRAKELANSHQLLFQIHAAETRHEYDSIRAERKSSPIEYLDNLGILDQNTLLVHGIWLDDQDIDIIAGKKAKVSHCPESNMKLASGVAPAARMIKAGIPLGLGTDGCASNNNLDLFRTMDMTAKIHKVNQMDPTAMNAKSVLKSATIDGAGAIGMDSEIGSLEPGKNADLIIVDTHQPHLVPMYNPVSHLVYTAQGNDVTTSIIHGKLVLHERKLMTMDLVDVLDQMNSMGERVKANL